EQDQRLLLPPAEGRILCVSEHHQDRLAVEETGRRAARTSRCCLPLWHRVRRIRRRLSPLQRSQFAREPEHGAAADRRLGREEPALKSGEPGVPPGRTCEDARRSTVSIPWRLCDLRDP